MAGIGNHIMFVIIFVGLTATYGLGSSTALDNQVNSLVQYINAPLPPPPRLPASNATTAKICLLTDFLCIGVPNPASPYLYPFQVIGASMVWLVQTIIAFITKMTAIGSLLPLLTLGTVGIASSVPFGNYIMIGLGLIIVLEIVRIIRGSSASGL